MSRLDSRQPPLPELEEADMLAQQSYVFRRHWTWYYIVGGAVLLPLFYGYFGFRVVGTVRCPTGPCLIVGNHRSNLDPFAVGVALPSRALTFMAKVELFRHPLLRYLLPRWGAFPFVRQISDTRGVRLLMAMLDRGEAVVLFPEGTRSRTGALGTFDAGFVRLAVRRRVPIILAAIKNTEKALPVGHRFPRPRVGITVHLAGPVELSEYYGRKLTPAAAERVAEELRARIQGMLAAMDTDSSPSRK